MIIHGQTLRTIGGLPVFSKWNGKETGSSPCRKTYLGFGSQIKISCKGLNKRTHDVTKERYLDVLRSQVPGEVLGLIADSVWEDMECTRVVGPQGRKWYRRGNQANTARKGQKGKPWWMELSLAKFCHKWSTPPPAVTLHPVPCGLHHYTLKGVKVTCWGDFLKF